jgi:hypothetical protein
MACQPEHVSLPLFCAHCGGAIELQYEAATNRDTLVPAAYDCPYCHEANRLKIPGRVLWVTERDAQHDIPARSRIQ